MSVHVKCGYISLVGIRHLVIVFSTPRIHLFPFQNEVSRIVSSENLARIEVSLLSGVHSTLIRETPFVHRRTVGIGRWYLQQVPSSCSVGKECQAKYSRRRCSGKGFAGDSWIYFYSTSVKCSLLGTWMLTTKGTLTVSTGATRQVQMWFCVNTSCTDSDIVIRQVTKYLWGTQQPCLPGSVVLVIGNLEDDEKDAILALCPIIIG